MINSVATKPPVPMSGYGVEKPKKRYNERAMDQGKFNFYKSRKGQVALMTIFLIGSFIVLMTLTLAFLSISIVSSNRAVQASNRALSVATAGVQDAVLRLIRNKSYSTATPFRIEVNGDFADVSVANTSDANGQAIITSTSTVNTSQKVIQAVISIVSSTGQVRVLSLRQI
jgi:hypothetical protein